MNDSETESDEDVPTLSNHALSALQEFYTEKFEAENQLQGSVGRLGNVQKTIPEDWVSEFATQHCVSSLCVFVAIF